VVTTTTDMFRTSCVAKPSVSPPDIGLERAMKQPQALAKCSAVFDRFHAENLSRSIGVKYDHTYMYSLVGVLPGVRLRPRHSVYRLFEVSTCTLRDKSLQGFQFGSFVCRGAFIFFFVIVYYCIRQGDVRLSPS